MEFNVFRKTFLGCFVEFVTCFYKENLLSKQIFSVLKSS